MVEIRIKTKMIIYQGSDVAKHLISYEKSHTLRLSKEEPDGDIIKELK